MPKGKNYSGAVPDAPPIKRTVRAAHSGHDMGGAEFGLMGNGGNVDGVPVDKSAAKALRKPADYNEHGTKAKTFV